MLEARPKQPTIRTSLGLPTSWGSTKRWMASRKMERHRATRKTPLISAPRVSARWNYARVSACWPRGEDCSYAIGEEARVVLCISSPHSPQADA